MVVDYAITFDNNLQGVYFSGQTVNGQIELKCKKPKKVSEVILKLKGFAHVHWTEESSTSSTDSNGNTTTSTSTSSYDGHEDYIKSKTWLLTGENRTDVQLETGTYTFRFNFQIPENCPSSFEGQYGHIRYFAQVTLVRPWKLNQSFTKTITVLKVTDLNRYHPIIKSPFSVAIIKTFGVWPFKSDPLEGKVMIPQRGYVPGQFIPISLCINNRSGVSILEVKARLVMNMTFFSTSPKSSKKSKLVVQKVRGPGISKKSKLTLNLNLPVPPTPATCVEACSIIHIIYEIEIELKASGIHTNPKTSMGVLIGNVPFLREDTASSSSQPRYNEALSPLLGESSSSPRSVNKLIEASSPTLQVQNISPGSDHPEMPSNSRGLSNVGPLDTIADLPPPSYEEAMHIPEGKHNGADDGGQDFGDKVFRPFYPRYNIPSPSSPSIEDIEKSFSQSTSLNEKK